MPSEWPPRVWPYPQHLSLMLGSGQLPVDAPPCSSGAISVALLAARDPLSLPCENGNLGPGEGEAEVGLWKHAEAPRVCSPCLCPHLWRLLWSQPLSPVASSPLGLRLK